jgi:hypothetical protein
MNILKPKLAWVMVGAGVPVILRVDRFEFIVHLNDHAPANVHVMTADGECRIVIEPDVVLDRIWSMNAIDARKAMRLAREHVATLRKAWDRIHGAED